MNERWQKPQRHEAEVLFLQLINHYLIDALPRICSVSLLEKISKPAYKHLQC